MNYDSFLYVVTDCEDIGSSCIGGADLVCSSSCSENVTATLTANTSYFVVVDAWSTVTNSVGEYTLTIDGPSGSCTPNCAGSTCGDDGCGGQCGTCGFGETCVAGICVDDGPSATGDTAYSRFSFLGCHIPTLETRPAIRRITKPPPVGAQGDDLVWGRVLRCGP